MKEKSDNQEKQILFEDPIIQTNSFYVNLKIKKEMQREEGWEGGEKDKRRREKILLD